MKSQTFQLRSIAPVAVAFSLTLAMAANAQNAPGPTQEKQLIVSTATNGSMPLQLFEAQEPVIDPAEFADQAKNNADQVVADKSSETATPGIEQTATTPVVETDKSSVLDTATKTVVSEKTAEAEDSAKGPAVVSDNQSAPPTETSTTETTASAPVEVTPDLSPVSFDSEETFSTVRAGATGHTGSLASSDSSDSSDSDVKLRGVPSTTSGDNTTGDTTLRPSDIAQSVPTDTTDSTDNRDFDLTPVSLPRRTPTFNKFESMKYSALYFLPPKMFFSAVVDNSLRAETNVFQTKSHNRTDMIYRILPNTTIGYALTRKTRVSANYFFLRDQYTKYTLLDRNFHSVGGQVDHDLYVKDGTSVTASFMGRALFITPDEQFSDTFFNDLLPMITASKQVGHATLYGSVVGQIRFREVLSQFQEGDQFYSFGSVYRNGPWQFLGDFTLNDNFGNSNLRQGHNNQVIILTEEIARRLPYMRKVPIDAYIRAQEIFNMGANSSPGYAGFNFRIFGGIRAYIAKPVVYPVKLAGK